MDGEARRKKLGTTAILPCGGKRDGGGGRKGREKKKVGGKRWKEKRQRRHTKEARLAWRPRVPTDSH